MSEAVSDTMGEGTGEGTGEGMGEPTVEGRGRTPAARAERVEVVPPLDPSEVVFLAGFGHRPVRAHGGRAVEARDRVARIWPGQPSAPSPWVPCAGGCCLELAPCVVPGAAGQWLRFLVDTFLAPDHHVTGEVAVAAGRGRSPAVLVVDGDEVFEGERDRPDAG